MLECLKSPDWIWHRDDVIAAVGIVAVLGSVLFACVGFGS